MKKIISFLLLYVCFVVSSIAQPVAGKTYLIVSCKYSGMYICEEADGTMVVSSKDNTKPPMQTKALSTSRIPLAATTFSLATRHQVVPVL